MKGQSGPVNLLYAWHLFPHLPQWRENEGADGHLTVAVSQAPDGTLVVEPRGHATVRTMTETTVVFPKT